MAADPVTVMAGGLRFYLIGSMKQPLGDVVHKFQDAMILARQNLDTAYTALAGPLTDRQKLVLEYCFSILPGPQAPMETITTIRAVLKACLDGLRVDDTKIWEPDPALLLANPGAEGYVTGIKGLGPFFHGDIHTRFDLEKTRTVHNLIHEATHRFWGTDDKGYIGNGISNWLKMRIDENQPGDSPMASSDFKKGRVTGKLPNDSDALRNLAFNKDALVNADSYATLAMNINPALG